MTYTDIEIIKKRFLEKTKTVLSCWIWTAGLTRGGYGCCRHEGKITRANRASWLIFRGNIPDGMCVLHRCDEPACVNPDHLFLGSMKDNMRDMIAKGRKRNARKYNSILTLKDAEEIRRRFIPGKGGSKGGNSLELAGEFNVSRTTIYLIVEGKRWKTPKYPFTEKDSSAITWKRP